MGRLQDFTKYAIWVIALYFFSVFMIYIGLNTTYSNIKSYKELPENVGVDLAQATSVNARIYGTVTSTENNNLEGKYLKVSIFNKLGRLAGIKYLKIEGTEFDVPKKFMVNAKDENINSYSIEIAENSEETEKKIKRAIELFDKKFTKEELTVGALILLVMYSIVG